MFKLRKLHFRQQQKKNELFAVTGFLVVLNLVNKVGNLTKNLNTSFNVYNWKWHHKASPFHVGK